MHERQIVFLNPCIIRFFIGKISKTTVRHIRNAIVKQREYYPVPFILFHLLQADLPALFHKQSMECE